MRMRDARALSEFWQDCPPENEMLALLAQVYTTWRPVHARQMTAEDHQKSLEARWAAGAMNAKQLFETMGGASAVAVRSDGTVASAQSLGTFPGAS